MVLECLSREYFIYTVNTKLFSSANHLHPGSEGCCQSFTRGTSIRHSLVMFAHDANKPAKTKRKAMSIPEKLLYEIHSQTSVRSDFLWRGMPTA